GIGGIDTLRGVYRKQLGQLGWAYTSNGLPANVAVNTFLVSDNMLFVGTSQGVYASENNGLHWEPSSFGMGEAPVVHSFYEAAGLLLAGTNAGLFVSYDHGGSWIASESLPSTSVVRCLAGNDTSIVAGTYNGGFISHDNGLSWSDFTPQAPDNVFFMSLTTLDNFYYAGTGAGIYTTNPDVAVSLSETRIIDHSGLLLYPNPIKRGQPLTIETQVGLSGIRIYDARGQLLRNIAPGHSPKNTICTASLAPGLYIIETIHAAEAISWKRFLVK
ncbi:MAG: T9SS type A sorting domain-containing protein, partial [Methylotenera sp.]|nr:T9SS type A sorting domain-containing protein [Methylotenera sp.]